MSTEIEHSWDGDSRPPDILLQFELSQDEEHACLRVRTRQGVVDLGERIHHYSLATLARLRLDDVRRGLDGCSQGWVSISELGRKLGVDTSYINVQVFRARQQFAAAMSRHAGTRPLIERRRGELRMGDYSFTVLRGAAMEGGLRHGLRGELNPV
jgi:hypothetical protein